MSAQPVRYRSVRQQNSFRATLRRLVGVLLVFFLTFSFFTAIVSESYRIDTASMSPTLAEGDRVVLLPLIYGPRLRAFGLVLPGFGVPQRGDLVAVRPGYMPPATIWNRIADPFVRFLSLQRRRAGAGTDWRSSVQIKRIVGLPGDTIRFERFVAYIKPEGSSVFRTEFDLAPVPYRIATGARPADWEALDPFGEAGDLQVLGPGEYFVLSDDRLSGVDSRHWGPVTYEEIDGKIVFRYWPFASWGRLR